MRTLLGCVATLALCFGVSAEDKKDEKIDAKKLVGKWEPKEKEKAFVIEFTKDGKLVITSTLDEKSKAEGSYKVDGKKILATLKLGGKEVTHTLTVSKLTDTELVSIDEDGKEGPLVRIKDK